MPFVSFYKKETIWLFFKKICISLFHIIDMDFHSFLTNFNIEYGEDI